MTRASLASALAGFAFVALGCSSSLESTGTCLGPQSLTIGVTASGIIGTDDCRDPEGNFGDLYQFTVASGTTGMLVTMNASGFEAAFSVYSGSPTALSSALLVGDADGSSTVASYFFLPAGTYFIAAGTSNGKGGSYTLQTQSPAQVADCGHFAYTLKGVAIGGTITTADCAGLNSARMDVYEVYLKSGQSLSASAALTFAGAVSIRSGDASTPDLASRIISAPGTAAVSYTATKNDWYRVHVFGTPSMGQGGSYTVTIQ